MKKKFVSILMATLVMASAATACGNKQETAAAPPAETKTEAAPESKPEEKPESKPEENPETTPETEAENDVEPADDAASGDFTLLDVSSEMITAGIYAVSEDGTELVFTMFTEPSGTSMASLFAFSVDGGGDVICGTYAAESETDEDGITWTLLTVADAYTGGEFEIGFGESEAGEVYIFDTNGTPYEGQYLSADETIDYMAAAAVLLE